MSSVMLPISELLHKDLLEDALSIYLDIPIDTMIVMVFVMNPVPTRFVIVIVVIIIL
jgi:hypothetical protein